MAKKDVRHSTVHHVGAPDANFTMIPNGLIRNPEVDHSTFRVIAWYASQADGRIIYRSKIAEELGMDPKTVRKAIDAALETPYLARTTTGGRDHQGNPTFVYWVNLEPMGISPSGRWEELPTKKTTLKKTNANYMPPTSVEGRQTPEVVQDDDTGNVQTPVVQPQPAATKKELAVLSNATWRVKPRHIRMIESYGLDGEEVFDCFLGAFFCDIPGCTNQPRSSNWDKKFSQFIHAYADDRWEIDFKNHYSEHHYDEEGTG